jgi:hypothetical protein
MFVCLHSNSEIDCVTGFLGGGVWWTFGVAVCQGAGDDASGGVGEASPRLVGQPGLAQACRRKQVEKTVQDEYCTLVIFVRTLPR